ncbi:alpha/beta fold hydrolase [Lactiplantibacillus plantarum]|uniref:alpha/beta fold hydrolase n=1 Tax=Lactiplantibacillus plantarum TaxID=1590 RepID=UPI0021C57186|nr:alpha/beta hydrolase [Lactiplantibacillus plantarum]
MENEQFNFQVNRFMEPYYDDREIQNVIKDTVQKITEQESWYQAWNKLGIQAEGQKQYDLASVYFQLADFFLGEEDARKQETYRRFSEDYYKSIDTSKLIFDKVPYQKGYMPVVRINHEHATKTILFHGGFDSYMEEIVRLTFSQGLYDALPDYNFILFEGPGQGNCLRTGVALTAEWEKPVGALLDYYQVEEADILGMSLGGYLATRAAAYEPRIKKVLAFDVMYDMSDALIMKMPGADKIVPKLAGNVALQEKFNATLVEKAQNNVDLAFKMRKGMDITLTKRPIDFVMEAVKYSMNGKLDRITQDVLLIGCSKDLYVPADTAAKEAAQLVNARSITTKVFTERSGGERHCQVGDKPLAAKCIIEFLNDEF